MTARRPLPAGPVRRQRGAASVEFYVVSFFVFIPLLMAVLQLGLFFVAKNTVNLATFAAARAGAVTGGDQGEMKQAFAKAVAPLYVGSGLTVMNNAGFTELSAGNYAQVMGVAYATALFKVNLPMDNIKPLNPTPASFTDFSISNPNGPGRIIPVTNLLTDTRVGTSSKQTRADSLLLKVEVRHCYDMIFPFIDKLVGELMLKVSLPSIDSACYAKHPSSYGIPIVSQAVVRMTVPPIESNFP
jgi:Flp pilus assembly protein TadG